MQPKVSVSSHFIQPGHSIADMELITTHSQHATPCDVAFFPTLCAETLSPPYILSANRRHLKVCPVWVLKQA